MPPQILYAGSTAWEWIGRKPPAAQKDAIAALEFAAPVRLTAIDAYLAIIPQTTATALTANTHCTSAHVILVVGGLAAAFGRNTNSQCGFVGTSRGEPTAILVDHEKWVAAATGRAHSVVVSESGHLYSSGENKLMQCGIDTSAKDVTSFTRVHIAAPKGAVGFVEPVFVSVACGADFTIAVTDEGKVYSFGSPQYGQTGLANDFQYIAGNNRIVFDPQLLRQIKFPKDTKIVGVSCGSNHVCALDSTGAIWTWGYAAYGRLGLNETPPKDHWTPTQITGFVERKNPVKHVCCGSSWGMCIDSRDALHVWGKWKNTGDGGQGTPWLYPKHFSGLSGWTLRAIGAGASSLFALGENSTVSWGQNCGSGELAHGEGNPRSATNSVLVEALEGTFVHSLACGAGNTLFVVDGDSEAYVKATIVENGGDGLQEAGGKRKNDVDAGAAVAAPKKKGRVSKKKAAADDE